MSRTRLAGAAAVAAAIVATSTLASCWLFAPLDDDAGADADIGNDDGIASDVSADGSTEAARWCATQGSHTFCADFDDSTDPWAGWLNKRISVTGDGAAIAIDEAGTSPPNAVVVFTTRAFAQGKLDSGDYDRASAYLTLELVSPAAAIHMSFDFRRDAVFPNSNLRALNFTIGPQGLQASLQTGDQFIFEQSGGSVTTTFQSGALANLGDWERIVIDVTLVRTKQVNVRRFTLDGGFVANVISDWPLDPAYHPTVPSIRFGAYDFVELPAAGTWFHFDNVIVDVDVFDGDAGADLDAMADAADAG